MMEQNIETAYGEGPGYKAVALPYLSQDVRMIVIVPDAGMFDATVAKLDDAFFREVHDGMTDSGVQLRMPKFSFESRPPLAMSLMALGMHEAFGPSADLSGFTGSRGLFISNVLHEAFVAVDEKGTEAAAATAVVIGRHTVPEQVQLDVDRPFIFAIYDEPTGQILFLGHVVDPS
jgi:serpin B